MIITINLKKIFNSKGNNLRIMSNPWKEYKKGVNYLKKNGLMVFIKMPPGGKTEWLQASPGLIINDKENKRIHGEI